ncbi:hypothetical protein [Moraxella lacunata]
MGMFLKFEMAITKIYNDKTAQKTTQIQNFWVVYFMSLIKINRANLTS